MYGGTHVRCVHVGIMHVYLHVCVAYTHIQACKHGFMHVFMMNYMRMYVGMFVHA